MKTLYLDMDGVLIDFDAGLARMGMQNNKSFLHLPKDQWLPDQHERFRQVCEQMNRQEFWDLLEPCPDAELLWNFCDLNFKMEVLTTVPPPQFNKITEGIKQSKLTAIANFFDDAFPSDRVNFCQREEKKKLAHAHAILVDDMIANCLEWTAAGGIAILHQSVEETIEALRSILA